MPSRYLQLDSAAADTVGPALVALRTELHVPQGFGPEAEAEAKAAVAAGAHAGAVPAPAADPRAAGTVAGAGARVDATAIEFLTIDPPGAKDLDQALHIERQGDGFVVHYAIADPASFVTPGGALDAELHERGMTFYGPDGSFSLHPKVLSEGAASLLPGEDRPACLWTITLDATGEITEAGVRRATVRSREQLTYELAHERINGSGAGQTLELLAVVGKLRQEREATRGGVSLEIPEQEVAHDDAGYRLVYRSTLPVEEWNAQISLLTGIAAAQLMRGKRMGIFRTLPAADPRDLARLRRAARGLGIEWTDQQTYRDVLATLDAAIPAHAAFYNEATSIFRGADYLPFDGELPAKAEHAAIAAEYAHVTAPLRRLVDRYALEICLAATADVDVPEWVREALPSLPKTMQSSGQRASAYERACVDLIEAVLLANRVGESFTGVVVDVDDPNERNRGRGGDGHGVQGGHGHGAQGGHGASNERAPGGTVVLADPAVRARIEGDGLTLGEQVRVKALSADPSTRQVLFALA